MSILRLKVVEDAIRRKAAEVTPPASRPSEYFGMYVFNQDKMRKYLPKKTYDIVVECINNHTYLERSVADSVAAGMKQWAMELGATHYTHWFQPLTGGTAEKHDAFIEPDGHGGVIEEFSGKLLIQQEPDASSFPNGGIRNTFEARGYSAWDPTSPAFIVDDTLCIPTLFISYTGDALDFKTPLLKSIEAVDKAATEVCKIFDPEVKKVKSFLGWEQEYFLVDEGLYAARPDLVLTGRTLMGHESAKNQQLEDHYFGSIPTRVTAFMQDLEFECLKLGIPAKTRHNEVAPNQFELAPIFEEINLANDHNLLLMSTIRRVARKHSFRVILHEKPFKGVNGSGKHNNWSLGTDTSINLYSPGKTPKENLLFMTFLANTLMAVYKYNGLLKASISNATNAHRLGANEAPPAIISVFLGEQISKVIAKIEKSKTDEDIKLDSKSGFRMPGLEHLPELLIDNTDRNRTSPFAFTGNRFEFRAVGSSANCAGPLTVINTAMAKQLIDFKKEFDKIVKKGISAEKAVYSIIKQYIKECKPIHFDGNGYTEEWKAEAGKRGLDCETSVPLIIDCMVSKKAEELYLSTGIMSKVEMHSRAEVNWETYTKKIQIEARVLGDLAMNHIMPVASRYQAQLVDKVFKINQIFTNGKADQIAERDIALIEQIGEHICAISNMTQEMVEARKVANKIEAEREKSIAYHDKVAPYLDSIRYHIDKLELIVDNEMWPLPKYRELLFLR